MARKTNIQNMKFHGILSCVDTISEKIQTYLDEHNIDSKQKHRIRLSAEECLLSWRDILGDDLDVSFSIGTRRGRHVISLSIECDHAVNPFEENNHYSESILARLGLAPSFSFDNGKNTLQYSIPKASRGPLIPLLIVIAAALIIGITTKIFVPDNVLNTILINILDPIVSKFFLVMKCVSGPMLFFSVAWGLYGVGDAASFKNVGGKLILHFLKVTCFTVLAGCLLIFLFRLDYSLSSSGSTDFSGIAQLLLDILPNDIFSPFISGNTLQIIVIGIVVGIVLLFLQKQTTTVARCVEQLNSLTQFVINQIIKIVPGFIFILILQLIWNGSYVVLASIWKFVAISIPAIIIVVMADIVYTSLRYKVRLGTLIKKGFPTFLISVSTASSAASFTTIYDCCTKKFGIDKNIVSFGVPLGFSLSKPIAAIYYLIISFYYAEVYGIEVSSIWIISAIILSIVLSMASPPIPGGAVAIYTLLFTQLGIPMEAFTVIIAVDVFFDFVVTAGNMIMIQNSLIGYTTKAKKIDTSVLQNDKLL